MFHGQPTTDDEQEQNVLVFMTNYGFGLIIKALTYKGFSLIGVKHQLFARLILKS
ncbi:MAG: hypothetical protein MGG37_00040 [Trichodesmium sp. MAG_R01]|nr:hypothetical protein [Trichodesmium sp. MAG_R01]